MSGFVDYVTSSISIALIASIFTYRLINSLLEYVLLPILNIFIDPDENISKLNFTFKTGKNNRTRKLASNPDANTDSPTYDILCGAFLKEVIIWFVFMIILYFMWSTEIAKK